MAGVKRTSAALGLGLGLLCAGCSADRRTFPGAPVVLISIDTLRSDHLPAYGYRGGEPPQLDRFRRDALLFESAWSPCPMTLPSHVTMLTGKNPPAHGVRNNLGFAFDSGAHASLPTLLRGSGYAAGAAVSSYVLRGETGLAAAFEWYEDSIEPRPGAAFVDYQRAGPLTAALAKDWLAQQRGRPFFLFLHLYEPHVPYDPPEPFRTRAAHPYDGEIAAADAVVGDVLDALGAAGRYDDAIVIVTSDHGEGLADHGEEQHSILLYREAIQVPLLVKLPGSRRKGETVAAAVQLADILPTVTELLGLAPPAAIDGSSLLAPRAARTLYAETLYPRLQLGWSDLRSATDGRHHLIDGPRPELYDMLADAGERHDLIDAQPGVAERLRAELRKVPAGDRAPRAVDRETLERIAALGYVGTPREPGEGPLPNPRDNIQLLGRLRDGLQHEHAGRYGAAAAALEGIVREQPGMVEAWSKLGDLRSRTGRHPEAAAAYREAVRRSGAPAAEQWLALGQAELRAGRFAESEAAAARAEKGAPGGTAELRARLALAQGRLDDAERLASALVERGRRPSAWVLLAEVRARRGAYADALASLAKGEERARELRLGPVFKLEFVRADTLARLERVADAEAAYRREIAAFPDQVQAYANLAVLQFLQGRREAVTDLMEQMVRANPTPYAYAVAEKTWAALGDRRSAQAWRRRAAGLR